MFEDRAAWWDQLAAGQSPLSVEQIVKLLGDERMQKVVPASVVRWASWVQRSGHQPQPTELMAISRQIATTIEASGAMTDSFFANLPSPEDLPASQRRVNLVQLPTGMMFHVDAERAFVALVMGMPRMGKTFAALYLVLQLVQLGCHAIVVERRNDFRPLFPALRERGIPCLVASASQVPFALFQGDPYNSQLDRELTVAESETLNELLGRSRAARLLNQVIADWRTRFGPGVGIPISDLITSLTRVRVSSGRERDLREGLLGDLHSLKAETDDAWEYFYSDFLEGRLAAPGVTILEGEGLGQRANQMVATLVQTRQFVRRGDAVVLKAMPPLFLVEDDATESVDAGLERDSLTKTSSKTRLAHLGQARNEGLVIIAHAPSAVSQKLRQMSDVVMLTRTQDDASFLKKTFNLTSDQVEALRRAEVGQAVAIAPGTYPKPVLGRVPALQLTMPSPEQMHEHLHAYRQTTTTLHRDQPLTSSRADQGDSKPSGSEQGQEETSSVSTEPAIDSNVLDLLVTFFQWPYVNTTKAYRRNRLNNRDGAAAIKRAKSADLLNSTVLPTGRRGASLKLHLMTKRGYDTLKAHGHASQSPPPHRGGEAHRLVVLAMRDMAIARGLAVDTEKELGGTVFDLALSKNGALFALAQVALSDPSREAKALLRAWGEPRVREAKLVLVARDRKTADAVIKQIKDANRDDLAAAIEVRIAGAVILDANRNL